jgi:lysophospholipase L1-like esterase
VRRVAALLLTLVVVAGCGGAGADGAGEREGAGDAGDAASSTSTTRPSLETGLPLLPTTTTTALDPMVDPPPPVPDPGGQPGRNSVFVMGDSVFLGTTAAIPRALPEWLVTYDAVGSRRLAQAIDVLAARRGEIGEAVVVQLGNNFIEGERGTYATQIDEAMAVLADVPRVVWVTVSEVSPTRVAINEAIRDAATRWPNLRVADWAPIIATFPGLTWDGLHLTPDGRREMATLIADTLGPIDYP